MPGPRTWLPMQSRKGQGLAPSIQILKVLQMQDADGDAAPDQALNLLRLGRMGHDNLQGQEGRSSSPVAQQQIRTPGLHRLFLLGGKKAGRTDGDEAALRADVNQRPAAADDVRGGGAAQPMQRSLPAAGRRARVRPVSEVRAADVPGPKNHRLPADPAKIIRALSSSPDSASGEIPGNARPKENREGIRRRGRPGSPRSVDGELSRGRDFRSLRPQAFTPSRRTGRGPPIPAPETEAFEELHPGERCRLPRGGSSSPRRGTPERDPFAFSIPSPLMSSRASCGGRGGGAGAFLRPPTPSPAHPRGFRGGSPGKRPGSGLPAPTAGWTRAGRPSIPWLCGEFLWEMARMIPDLRENSPETPRPKTPGLGRGRSGPGQSAIPWGQDRSAIAQRYRVPSLASLAPRPSRPRALLLTLLITLLLGGASALALLPPPMPRDLEPVFRIQGPAGTLLTEPPGEARARPLSPRPPPPGLSGSESRY